MSKPSPSDASDLLRGLRQRRKYRDEPIPDAILTDILEVARWTGSAKNTQPWNFVVVRNDDTLRTLSTSGEFAGFLGSVELAIVIAMHPGSTPYDEGRVSERIMLIADAYGLSSGTGWFNAGGSTAVKGLLGIPNEMICRSAVGLGYPDLTVPDPVPVTWGRRPLTDLVGYKRYGNQKP